MELAIEFLESIAVLIVPALLMGLFSTWLDQPRWMSRIAVGLLFGTAGLLTMADPIEFRPGLYFDARNVVVVLAGPAGGPLAVLVTTAMVATMRAAAGGAGLVPALVSIGLAAFTSISFCRYFERQGRSFSYANLHVLAGLAALPPLVSVLFLPTWALAGEMLVTWIPLSAITNLIGVELLGLLMLRERERREVAAALAESSARLRAIADNVPGVLYQRVREPGGRISYRYASDGVEDVLGISPADVIRDPSSVLSMMLPEDLETYRRSVEVSRRTMRPWLFEARFKRKDGRIVWLRGQAAPRPGPNGETLWDGFALDITDRKQLEEELTEARRAAETASAAKGRFLANVTHELRAPLNAIVGYAHLVERGLQKSGQHGHERHMLRMIQSATQHLGSMVDDLLDMSAIEADRLQLVQEHLDLEQIMGEVEQILRVQADHVGIVLTFEVPRSCRIYADPRRLKQILLNLGSNAIKFTAAGGAVSVRAERSAGGCTIIVADTGIGIAAEDLNHILQPFGQIDNVINRRGGGTGLGLPLTKRLVELHGGELNLQSTLGKGTIVSITLLDTPVANPSGDKSATGCSLEIPSSRVISSSS